MLRHTLPIISASASLLLTPNALGAQRVDRSPLGISAGAAFPSHDLTDDADPGHAAAVHLERSLGPRLRVRLGADVVRFPMPAWAPGHWLMVGGMTHLVAPIRMPGSVWPYFLVGAGATHVSLAQKGQPTLTTTSVTIGAGIGYDFRLIGTMWFAEGRLISVRTKFADGHPLYYVPVVLGFRF